jgi:hypothetical protein
MANAVTDASHYDHGVERTLDKLPSEDKIEVYQNIQIVEFV